MLKDKEGERLETMPEDQFTSPTAIALVPHLQSKAFPAIKERRSLYR
jgi:hypothetical protein